MCPVPKKALKEQAVADAEWFFEYSERKNQQTHRTETTQRPGRASDAQYSRQVRECPISRKK